MMLHVVDLGFQPSLALTQAQSQYKTMKIYKIYKVQST